MHVGAEQQDIVLIDVANGIVGDVERFDRRAAGFDRRFKPGGVRARAAEFRVDTAHVGIMGFSAGGELAAYAETRWDRGNADSSDPIERQSSRPDFVVLGYPAGKAANLTFTKETPSTFIVVNNDDNLAPNSTDYYAAIRKAGVPVEIHVYLHGGHGFGMTGRTPEFAKWPVSGWPGRFKEWMLDQGFLR